ncbi:hypothetical protein BJ912DRAFT_1054794 [Pholiota molesta]|nr:hypothetical protein BJ912DRAFT_1054794 [Pholiota molesta]
MSSRVLDDGEMTGKCICRSFKLRLKAKSTKILVDFAFNLLRPPLHDAAAATPPPPVPPADHHHHPKVARRAPLPSNEGCGPALLLPTSDTADVRAPQPPPPPPPAALDLPPPAAAACPSPPTRDGGRAGWGKRLGRYSQSKRSQRLERYRQAQPLGLGVGGQVPGAGRLGTGQRALGAIAPAVPLWPTHLHLACIGRGTDRAQPLGTECGPKGAGRRTAGYRTAGAGRYSAYRPALAHPPPPCSHRVRQRSPSHGQRAHLTASPAASAHDRRGATASEPRPTSTKDRGHDNDNQRARRTASELERQPASTADDQRTRRTASEHNGRPASPKNGQRTRRTASEPEERPASPTHVQRAERMASQRGWTIAREGDHDGWDGEGDGRWGQRTARAAAADGGGGSKDEHLLILSLLFFLFSVVFTPPTPPYSYSPKHPPAPAPIHSALHIPLPLLGYMAHTPITRSPSHQLVIHGAPGTSSKIPCQKTHG